jgi:hypothetical protein
VDHRPVYSDEEFALILRKAAELAEPAAPGSHTSGGLTLGEMKAAAAQAGFDPALVERAARLLRANATAAPSVMERLIGGRARHGSEAHFPIALDEAGAARLLSALRIGVGRSGEGHSGPTGLTWRSAEDGGAVLSLTVLADRDDTSVTADLDRRGTLFLVGGLTAAGSFMALLFGATVAGEILPGFEAVGGLTGAGAVLALARSYWASSTQTARERLDRAMDIFNRSLTSGNASFVGAVGQRGKPAGNEGEPAGNMSKPVAGEEP